MEQVSRIGCWDNLNPWKTHGTPFNYCMVNKIYRNTHGKSYSYEIDSLLVKAMGFQKSFPTNPFLLRVKFILFLLTLLLEIFELLQCGNCNGSPKCLISEDTILMQQLSTSVKSK